MPDLANAARVAFYFAAITSAFSVYSLIQERLMTVPFSPGEEVFTYSVFVVLVNRLVTCAVSAAALAAVGAELRPTAPLGLFAIPSVANVIGSTAQYEALKYVSFPLQALAKCAKSLPVMAWNLVTRTRSYSRQDYVSAATVTAGCALFVLGGDITAPGAAGRAGAGAAGALGSTTGLGLALLAAFMVFDGLTSTSQDSLFANYDMHPCSQLLYTAAWSAALSAGFLLASGQLAGALAFVGRHPASMWLILGQSAVSTAVQVFIVFTIKRYGALNFALMMTVRQYFSIVLSCLVFGHELRGAQWAGTLAVVAGLAVRALDRSRGAGPKALRALADAGDAGEAERLVAAAAGRPGGKGAIPVLVAASPRAATPGLHARALHAQGSGDFRERVEKLEKAF